ncbi:hypothetical protein DWU89_17755 [Parabacteroides acidifaciens]|uniref:Uncharacterized protein n=1 Tax=Parabacteroides acidifaciens TaxID=2290935 RepID=A0A3D8HA36_9BACT|nr:hypothetical protein DWU89_17755 [Parabacteroides acidifaciens]
MLHNIKALYLHCVFHGIRFKVNNEDWLSVMDSLFFAQYEIFSFCFFYQWKSKPKGRSFS